MKPKNMLVSILVVVWGLSSLGPGSLSKASTVVQGEVIADNVQKNEGIGAVESIKSDTSGLLETAAAAPNPSGEESESMCECEVVIDNHTRNQIRIFVDGFDRGVVNPGSRISRYTGAGWTRLYGITYFNDGSTDHWGPRQVYCDGFYQWGLYY